MLVNANWVLTVLWLCCRGFPPVGAVPCQPLAWRSFECRELSSLQDLLGVGGADNWHSLAVHNERTELELDSDTTLQLLSNLSDLDLSAVQQLNLRTRGFSSLPNLRHLNISGCGLAELRGSHFAAESALQQLDASHNRLELLTKDVLRNLRKLIYANFSHNALTDCELPHLPLLNRLELGHNRLVNVSFGVCPQLQQLLLQGNRLAQLHVSAFRGLHGLLELQLSGNGLSLIAQETFLPLNQLRVLNLSHNALDALRPNVFGAAQNFVLNLQQLDLAANRIRLLFDNQFRVLPRLQLLDLSRNSIASLSGGHFVGLGSLRKLYLQSNDILEIKPDAFAALPNLDTLDLSHNSLEYFEEQAFGGNTMTRLRRLNLNANRLKRLHPLAFSSLPYLEYLRLGHNELASLDVRMFAPMRHLQKLHLGHNALEEITSDVMDCLSSVMELLIDHNRLTYLSAGNDTFPSLNRIAIEGNPWQCSCFVELQQWLTAKRVTYLRENTGYYKGERPLCVITAVDYCIRNLQAARRQNVHAEFDEVEQADTDENDASVAAD
ncbi:insulin-like growth factor-binding protein complex acid labile subunit [Drosophila guanche]|nr:insulin-like growth factor-binding protein complex acid labile subunit [Drosophila guanche]